jgi:hypothetical protein
VTADSLLAIVPAAAAALDSAAFAWASALVGRPRLRFACAPEVAEDCGMAIMPLCPSFLGLGANWRPGGPVG